MTFGEQLVQFLFNEIVQSISILRCIMYCLLRYYKEPDAASEAVPPKAETMLKQTLIILIYTFWCS